MVCGTGWARAPANIAVRTAKTERPFILNRWGWLGRTAGTRAVCAVLCGAISSPQLMMWSPRLFGSEVCGEIDLQGVLGELGAGDLVGGEPLQIEGGVVEETEAAADHPTLGVGTAQVEVLIVEGIEHRVRLDIFVVDEGVPIPAPVGGGMAEVDAGKPGLVAVLEEVGTTRTGTGLAGGDADRAGLIVVDDGQRLDGTGAVAQIVGKIAHEGQMQ